MLCLKVANKSLFDFIKLPISPTEKEPIRKLSKSNNVINKTPILKKKLNCSNCVQKLNVRDADHRANGNNCPLNGDN